MSGSLLALDPGGSKCTALLIGADGRVAGLGLGEAPGRGGRSAASILAAAQQALGALAPDGVQVAYTDSYYIEPSVFHHPLFRQYAPVRVSEESCALRLAGVVHGLVVLAGTGSFVYGRTRDGRELKLDGIGPVLGDTGGGYYIGLMALRAAAKSDWHPRFFTSLRQRVYQFYGLRNFESLVHFSLAPHDRSVIASFTRIVDEEASAGDRIARRLLEEAAEEIADILSAVVDRLEITDEEYVLVGTGSVMISYLYWNHLVTQARRIAPGLRPVRSPHPPVVGVALAARRRLCGGEDPAADAALLASYEAYIRSHPPDRRHPAPAPGMQPSAITGQNKIAV